MTLKLLVADDSITIQKVVGLAFAGEDAVVESVSSGELALEKVKTFKPDVVLADIFMPGCNGYEVCAGIKQDPELAHTAVVLLVGTFEPFDEQEALKVKSDGRLTKPFDTSELMQTVRSLARGKMSPQEVDPSLRLEQSSTETREICCEVKGLVSSSARKSFLGSARILDVFDQETLASANVQEVGFAQGQDAASLKEGVEGGTEVSEEIIGTIVDKVIRRVSVEVVREVAWEVVPEISEMVLRQFLQDQGKSITGVPPMPSRRN